MLTAASLQKAKSQAWTDEQVVEHVLEGETALFEILMRRYNQRLYRIARAILRDDGEAEDVTQDAYVRAYEHLSQFSGRAPFSSWLTRIAVNEALARQRRRNRNEQLDTDTENRESSMNLVANAPSPEQTATQAELSRLLESAVLALPEQYRVVLMMRDVEEMSTAETAEILDLTEDNVKVRLHRGHAMMRRELLARLGTAAKEAFPFLGSRCDRIVENVLKRLACN